MILLYFLFGWRGNELRIDQVAPRLDVRNPGPQSEAFEFFQRFQRRDGVALSHIVKDALGLGLTSPGVFIDVLHRDYD